MTCCSLIYGSSAKVCLQDPYNFEHFCFPKILTTNLKLAQTVFSSPWMSLSKYSSLIWSRICGPMKILSFNFVSLSLGNFSRKFLLRSWSLQNFLSDQAINAWMATKFYSVPLVVDFPHSWFLVPGIFWQANPFLTNEETELCCPIHKLTSKILWIIVVIQVVRQSLLGHIRFAI